MKLKVGERLQSVVCDTEVIVIGAPAEPVSLTCGGREMVPAGAEAPRRGPRDPGAAAGVQLGKRYADEDLGLELLVTKAGNGPLAVDGAPLEIKQPKPLPSSD
jgi:hypothetical protein